MKDFTKKGTKLPVVPKGVEYSTTLGCSLKHKFDKNNPKSQRYKLYSIGLYDNEYLICDEKKYLESNSNHFIIKLSTIERLAKEQGMYDGCIDFEFIKDWWHMLPSSKNQELRQIYFKNHIGFLGIDRLFFIYKSEINNENTKVTLQENGTVTVTDTETTTTLSKVTVDEICRLVKEQPNPTIELNKWNYWDCKEDDVKMLLFVTGVDYENHKVKVYGFRNDEWVDECNCYCNLKNFNDAIYNYKPASPETVQQYFTDEAVRRGFKKGVKVKNHQGTFVLEDLDIVFNTAYNDGIYTRQGSGVWLCMNGIWATIIQPETITRAEAEKQLGKVITD